MRFRWLFPLISKIRQNKKLLLTVQVSGLILISGSLSGMLVYTDIYDEVESGIVKVLCLSCIKLQPRTSKEFTFKTANKQQHPDFIVDTLKNKGPILIQYGEKACVACDDMIANVIKPYFDLDFDKTKSFETEINLENLSFMYIYIYIDDGSTSEERKNSYDVYDKDHIRGFPMFTIITIEYDHGGYIKPYYTSLYGKFETNNNYEKMYETFVELLEFSNELYDRNIAGFE